MCLESILGDTSEVGGAGLFLTFGKVIGRVSGRAACLHKKNTLCSTTSDNTISNPMERKIDTACFRKCLKTTSFDAIFVAPNWIFLERKFH